MDLQLNGKVALVTGASGGIGAAIASELALEGVDLCLTGRDRGKLEQVVAGLDYSGRPPTAVACDLSAPEAPAAAIETAIASYGRLDIVVNCAGDTKRSDFFKLSEEDWQDGFSMKFHGCVRVTRAAWPHLRETKGVMVNIVGIGARFGSAEFTIGGAVNVALLNFTKAMADLGVRDGVRVNAVNPGLIETERLTRNIQRVMRERSCSREDAVARLLAARGISRFGRPEEVAWLVAYLASAKAEFIQGAVIDIDGGALRAL